VSAIEIDTGQLSRRGKAFALAILTFGLLTFFVPMIEIKPPDHGVAHLSPLDIFVEVQSALSHGQDIPLIFVLFGSAYLILVLAAGVTLLLPFRKLLRAISLAGGFILLYPFSGILGGLRLAAFVESAGRGSDLTMLWVILGMALFAVAVVTWTDATT